MTAYNYGVSNSFLNSNRKYDILHDYLLNIEFFDQIIYNETSVDIVFTQEIDISAIDSFMSILDISQLNPNTSYTVDQLRDKIIKIIDLINLL
jgi:hypothetical protein